ncbi:MAG: S41 family peptidase [Patescibacteria group bacterium]
METTPSKTKNLEKILIVGLIFLGGFLIGNFSPAIAANSASRNTPEGFDTKTFTKVWEILDNEFVTTSHRDPFSSDDDRGSTSTATTSSDSLSVAERRLYGAIKGMVDAEGDPYTTFFVPTEASSFESEIKGSFEGVGMEVGKKDGIITIISPLPGSPAEKAGLKSGDKILKIDKTITTDMAIDAAVNLIRGKKGTEVALTIYREGIDQPLEIKVLRDTIELPTITKNFDQATGVYTIKIHSFSEQVASMFTQALKEFKAAGAKKLIIDLRGNPGGYLDSAVDIASHFIPQGKIIVSQDYGKKKETEYMRSLGYGTIGSDVKVVVLIDGGSASASEILAGALQDYKLATLVGQKTFGKGSVQEYIKVTPTTGLKVTIARWLTPEGRSISVNGLTPDIEVKITEEDAKKQNDSQQKKAVEILAK